MKKVIILVLLVVAGVAGYLGWRFTQHGLTVEITQAQLQTQLNSKFPIEKRYLVVNLTLTDPKVVLKETSDRIFIGAGVSVSVPLEAKATGSATLSGNVTYQPDQGTFLLTDLRVEDLQVTGLSGSNLEIAKKVLGQIGAQVLNRIPVYQLDEKDRTQRLAKAFLKSVTVAGGKLQITLGV